MRDAAKTKKQLIEELTRLRQHCTALEARLSPPPASPAVCIDPVWYRQVVEHSQVLICMHDLDGVLLFVNPAAAQVLGYKPHEGIGKKLSLFLAPSVRPFFEAYLERIRSQPTDSGLMRVITKHGQERVWAYHNIRYEEPGQPPYVLGHAQDITEEITERMRREEELQQARDELENRVAQRTAELQRAQELSVKAFQASPNAIMLIDDIDGRYIDVNPGFQHLTGYSRDEVVGHTSSEFELWVNRQERATVIRLFREQGVVYDFEVRFRTKSGMIREVLLSVEGIELDGVPCSLSFAHDVTDRRALERELISMSRELIEISERERQRIGYDLHDTLGQQLAGIAFLSKALAQRLTAHKAAEATQAAQIVTFVNQAIEQARTLAGGLAPVTLETYGLVFALQELAASVEALFHCACKISSHHAIHITDHAVAIHLYRIVQEAVNNAIQHGKALQITITLSARREGGMILMVHDDGIGLPTGVATRRGMGLRIMHHRARMIGAILEVQRGAHGGTCVICTLRNPMLVSVNQMLSSA
jgi:PAS domain S-box-containing protein